MNKVMLFGRLGRDPEVRATAEHGKVCHLSVATTERFKDKAGEWQEATEWHRVVAFGRTAETCEQYLAKGREVLVEGRLRTREWQDQAGNRRHTTEVVAANVTFAGGSRADGGGEEPSREERHPCPPEEEPRDRHDDEGEDRAGSPGREAGRAPAPPSKRHADDPLRLRRMPMTTDDGPRTSGCAPASSDAPPSRATPCSSPTRTSWTSFPRSAGRSLERSSPTRSSPGRKTETFDRPRPEGCRGRRGQTSRPATATPVRPNPTRCERHEPCPTSPRRRFGMPGSAGASSPAYHAASCGLGQGEAARTIASAKRSGDGAR